MATFTRLKSVRGVPKSGARANMSTRPFSSGKALKNGRSTSTGELDRLIDRQEHSATRSRDAKPFGDLIALHRADLEESGKKVGR